MACASLGASRRSFPFLLAPDHKRLEASTRRVVARAMARFGHTFGLRSFAPLPLGASGAGGEFGGWLHSVCTRRAKGESLHAVLFCPPSIGQISVDPRHSASDSLAKTKPISAISSQTTNDALDAVDKYDADSFATILAMLDRRKAGAAAWEPGAAAWESVFCDRAVVF